MELTPSDSGLSGKCEMRFAGHDDTVMDDLIRLDAALSSNAGLKTLSVNRELILLYWSIGQDILRRQNEQSWGAKIIDHLAVDLSRAFPEVTGFRSEKS